MSDSIDRHEAIKAEEKDLKCGKRWISVRPQETLLKELECENCGAGYVVETGQILEN